MFYVNKRDLRNFFIIFSVLLFILLLPSLLGLQSVSEKQSTKDRNIIASNMATVSSVFNNNLINAILSLVPYFGWGWLLAVLWNTGTVLASYGLPWYYIFTNPFVYVELGVSSFVVLKSIRLWQLFLRRKTKFTDLDGVVVVRKTTGVYYDMIKTVAIVLAVCSIVLLVSAYVKIVLLRL